eukprot:7112013-Alexandrium_andersonii.AAC.1
MALIFTGSNCPEARQRTLLYPIGVHASCKSSRDSTRRTTSASTATITRMLLLVQTLMRASSPSAIRSASLRVATRR